jgi:hypothetical protein
MQQKQVFKIISKDNKTPDQFYADQSKETQKKTEVRKTELLVLASR